MRAVVPAQATPPERQAVRADGKIEPSAAAAPSPAAPAAPSEQQTFRTLMELVQDGSEQAIAELQERYGAHIVRAVRRRLPRQLRSKFDSVDIVQDVWMSFFRMGVQDFPSPEKLIAYLARMARNKVIDVTRARLEAKRRDVHREERLADGAPRQEAQRLYARDSTPSQAAIGRELWDLMLEGQPPVYRQVLMLLRDGCSQVEVAARMNLSCRTVQRILNRALERTRS
jgi:RNA polymerase sigma-70 factor (ECF subfamily)